MLEHKVSVAFVSAKKQDGTRISKIGLLLNIIICVIELISGLITGSLSLVANSFHDLTDGISSIITWITLKVRNKPPDKKHPYGYMRVEILSSMIEGSILFFIGVSFLKESVGKILNPSLPSFSASVVFCMAFAVIIKIVLSWLYNTAAKNMNSPSLKAAGVDAFTDVFVLVLALASVVFAHWHINIDSVSSLILSLFICVSAVRIVGSIISPLIGESPKSDLISKINSLIFEHKEVCAISSMNLFDYGKWYGDISLVFSDNMEFGEAAKISYEIEQELFNKYNLSIVVRAGTSKYRITKEV